MRLFMPNDDETRVKSHHNAPFSMNFRGPIATHQRFNSIPNFVCDTTLVHYCKLRAHVRAHWLKAFCTTATPIGELFPFDGIRNDNEFIVETHSSVVEWSTIFLYCHWAFGKRSAWTVYLLCYCNIQAARKWNVRKSSAKVMRILEDFFGISLMTKLVVLLW